MWKILYDGVTMQAANNAESFFVKKRNEEMRIEESRMNETNSTDTDANALFGNPIENLMRGPYLNPEAPDYIPKFG